MVVGALRANGDLLFFDVDWRDPGMPSGSPFHEIIAQPHIIRLADEQALTEHVRRSVDPYDPIGATIRSIATCRAATFGYDGQAFLCLRHEDIAPVSADQSLVEIKEWSGYLTETDYFDGYIRQVQSGG